MGFLEWCGEEDYFPPKPKDGANSWITALQDSSHSLAGVGFLPLLSLLKHGGREERGQDTPKSHRNLEK